MRRLVILTLLVLIATTAYAADPFLLHDLPLGSTLARAQKLIPTLAQAEAPASLEAWRATGPIGEARDIRLIFRAGKLASISFATGPGTVKRVRQALANVLGPFTPAADGHWAYEARRGAQRLQVFRHEDDSTWVVWLDTAQFVAADGGLGAWDLSLEGWEAMPNAWPITPQASARLSSPKSSHKPQDLPRLEPGSPS
jgi:hypothetical protein